MSLVTAYWEETDASHPLNTPDANARLDIRPYPALVEKLHFEFGVYVAFTLAEESTAVIKNPLPGITRRPALAMKLPRRTFRVADPEKP